MSFLVLYLYILLHTTYQASGIDLLTNLRVDTRPCLQPDIRTMGQVPIHGGGFGTFAAIKTGLSLNRRKEKGINI